MSELLIEVEGFNGEWFTIHGAGAGDRGVYLGPSPDGMYDEPTQTIWNSTAFQTGATPGGMRVDKRTLTLGMLVTETPSDTWQSNDSEFRKAWSYKQDSKLWVTTEDSRRYLKCRLMETPKFAPEFDPFDAQFGEPVYSLAAGNPRWCEDDQTDTWINTVDTTGSGAGYSMGTVHVWNPTDQPQYLKYQLQAYPGAKYKLPDYSFGNDYQDRAVEDANRMIIMPALIAGEHLRVDTTDEGEQVVSDIDTQAWQRMNGVQFLYPIPPYTGTASNPVALSVGVTGAPAGVGVQVRCPRQWSRPWGLQ